MTKSKLKLMCFTPLLRNIHLNERLFMILLVLETKLKAKVGVYFCNKLVFFYEHVCVFALNI